MKRIKDSLQIGSGNCFFGVETSLGERGFVMLERSSGWYRLHKIEGITWCETFPTYDNYSIRSMFNEKVAARGEKMFEFKTGKALMTWVAKGK